MPMKPKSSESKQDFLARCIKDGNELRACVASWNTERLEDQIDEHKITMAAAGLVALADAGPDADKPARFAILAYTGKVIDRGWWNPLVIDMSGITTQEKMPILRQHDHTRVVGLADTMSQDASGLYLEGSFSLVTMDGQEVLGLAREGFPWQASIGVEGRTIEEIKAGDMAEVNGREVSGPIDIWRESLVYETSFVPFGADDNTAAVAMSAAQPKTPHQEEQDMSKEKKDTMNPVPAEQAAAAAADDAIKRATEEAAQKAAEEAAQQECERGLEIRTCVQTAGLDATLADTLIKERVSLADAKSRVLDELSKKNKPAPKSHSMEMGEADRDKRHAAVVDGLCARFGMRPAEGEKFAAGHEAFMGVGLRQIGAQLLAAAGRHDAYGMSPTQLARAIIQDAKAAALAGGHSTSDFPEIFRDVSNKRLLNAYNEAQATWRPIVREVTVNDYKTIYGISLGELPVTELVTESGEYKEASLSEKRESYAVKKYGKLISITEEMIVNDDLRAFDRLPGMLGAAARRKESDLVWALFLSNPTMNEDDTALFHSNHSNLAGTGAAITSASLSAGRAAMRKQKGVDARTTLDLIANYLLIPVALETDAEVLLRSVALPEATYSAGVYNPWTDRLTPIAEPRLDAADANAWYLAASPSQIDTIEVARLAGMAGPEVSQDVEFRRDAITYKVKHTFGCGVMDYRGFYKNAGPS